LQGEAQHIREHCAEGSMVEESRSVQENQKNLEFSGGVRVCSLYGKGAPISILPILLFIIIYLFFRKEI